MDKEKGHECLAAERIVFGGESPKWVEVTRHPFPADAREEFILPVPWRGRPPRSGAGGLPMGGRPGRRLVRIAAVRGMDRRSEMKAGKREEPGDRPATALVKAPVGQCRPLAGGLAQRLRNPAAQLIEAALVAAAQTKSRRMTGHNFEWQG